jgi:hypothetical protein
VSIYERLQEAAQAIDELFADDGAEAAKRYQRLLAALQDSENVPPSAIKVDSPAPSAPQPASPRSAPATAPQQGPTEHPSLTDRQRKVIEVIRDSVQRRGYPPSVREIGEAVGLSSISSVAFQLKALERKGYLRRDPSRPRAYEVQGAAQAPTSGKYSYKPGRATTPEHETDSRNVKEPVPTRATQPGDEALKERVRGAWACVEQLRRESDEQGRYLHRKPLTNADLADHIGKSDRTVSRWLHDQNFMPSRAEFLGIIEKLGGDRDEYDFIWHEGYVAYEALKGMANTEPNLPRPPREQRQLSGAADGYPGGRAILPL